MIVINNTATSGGSSDILIGSIVMWYGSASAVPTGYLICDGTGGSTPDIRGRFVRGASNNAELLTTGGSATHLHAGGGSDEKGSHTHAYTSMTSGGASSTAKYSTYTSAYSSGGHTHSISGNLGNGGLHSHTSVGVSSLASSFPPYKMLYWVKRIF